jgi:hypothetical protein
MGQHAKRILQPSGFHRTMNCPGWGNLCTKHKLPPSGANVYSAKGSVEHKLGEVCLRHNKSPYDYVGAIGWHHDNQTGLWSQPENFVGHNMDYVFEITDEMAVAVDVYVQECRRKVAEAVGAFSGIEVKMSVSHMVPGMFGTGDHVIIEPLVRVDVTDYKGGFHLVEVGKEPGDNPQLTIYALGALQKDNPHMCEYARVSIVQPHKPHPEGSIRTVKFPVKRLLEWGKDVLVPAAKLAQTPDAPIKAGPWCVYCDAENALDSDERPICPAKRAQEEHAVVDMFGQGTTIATIDKAPEMDAKVLSGDRLDRILQAIPIIQGRIKQIQEEAYDRLEKGLPNAPKNYKLVPGKMSNREWKGDAKVEKAFKHALSREELYIEKIKTPPK